MFLKYWVLTLRNGNGLGGARLRKSITGRKAEYCSRICFVCGMESDSNKVCWRVGNETKGLDLEK